MQSDQSWSGVTTLGNIPWGSHFCQFFGSRQDLVETLVPFFKAGLENNEKCLWITSDPFDVEDARVELAKVYPKLEEAEKSGQIEIFNHAEWYTRSGQTDADATVEMWIQKQKAALEEGYAGLRLTGSTTWLKKNEWGNFTEYERKVNEKFRHHRIIGLCTYCLDNVHSSGVLDVVKNHDFALVPKESRWDLIESSQLKQAKAQISKLNNEMESRVEERTRQLAASQKQLSLVTNAVPVLRSCVDTTYRYRYINEAYTKWFGYESVDTVGRTMKSVLGEQVFLAVKPHMDQALRGTKVSFEKDLNYIDGSKRYVNILYVPDFDSEDKVRGVVALVNDITEKRKSEIEKEDLLNRVQAASKSRDQFLATLSHELRTPLNVVMGWIQMLKTEKLDSIAFDKALETIDRNMQIQKELIDDLLDISRIITGKLVVELRPLTLTPIIESVVTALHHKASEKNLNIEMEMTGAPIINGDELRISQVLSNLLTNAIKFSDSGGSIKISLTTSDSEVQVKISDDGKGIDPNFLPSLFEPLKQEDMETTRVHGGLGLGLAISKNIVELHKGTIEAFSGGRGKGSQFTLRLPLLLKKAATNIPSDHARTLDPRLNDLKVLVVDDSEDILSLVSLWLTKAGALVETANSAKNALAKIHVFKPDVLLSDIGMPDEDGLSLMRKIRSMHLQKPIKAAALTAYARDEEKNRGIEAGFLIHIPKPVSKQLLLKSVFDLSQLSVIESADTVA